MTDNMPAAVRDVLADAESRELPKPTPREARLLELERKVDAVVGMRRVGKSWLLLAAMRGLLERGVPRSRMLYVEFEDERLSGMRTEDLRLIDETFRAELDENLFEEFQRQILLRGEGRKLNERMPLRLGDAEIDERPQGVFAAFGKSHKTTIRVGIKSLLVK